MTLPKYQRGMGMFGWIFVIMIAAFFLVVGAKSFPVYMNHYKIVSILHSIANQPGASENPPNEIQRSLAARFDVDMVSRVEPTDVKVSGMSSDERELSLEYEVRVPMFYNVDAVYSFSEKVPLK